MQYPVYTFENRYTSISCKVVTSQSIFPSESMRNWLKCLVIVSWKRFHTKFLQNYETKNRFINNWFMQMNERGSSSIFYWCKSSQSIVEWQMWKMKKQRNDLKFVLLSYLIRKSEFSINNDIKHIFKKYYLVSNKTANRKDWRGNNTVWKHVETMPFRFRSNV